MRFSLYLTCLPWAETKLIERIRKLTGRATSRAVIQSIGDDCAILRVSASHELLLTTDLSVEDVHFRRTWHPSQSVGHRCLARGLSDIAAMGGEPLACFLSLGLPAHLPQRWVDGFFEGFNKLARRYKVQLAGGDISASRQIVADIVVAGQAPAGKALLRSGARPGDRLYVTGTLGGPAGVLQRLYAGKRIPASASSSHFYPKPRLEVGQWIRRHGLATAMIDLSDGISVDLAHICQESRVTATIQAANLPIAQDADLALALHGGEDYELLFTARPGAKIPLAIRGVKVAEIGSIGTGKDYPPAIQILDENGYRQTLQPLGWEHFRKRIQKRR
jgi:thiamine-monophosphate kinase